MSLQDWILHRLGSDAAAQTKITFCITYGKFSYGVMLIQHLLLLYEVLGVYDGIVVYAGIQNRAIQVCPHRI